MTSNDSASQQLKLKIRYGNNPAVSTTNSSVLSNNEHSTNLFNHTPHEQPFIGSAYAVTPVAAKKPRGRPRKDSLSTPYWANTDAVTNEALFNVGKLNSNDSNDTLPKPNASHGHTTLGVDKADAAKPREPQKFIQKQHQPSVVRASIASSENMPSAQLHTAGNSNLRTNISQAFGGIMSSSALFCAEITNSHHTTTSGGGMVLDDRHRNHSDKAVTKNRTENRRLFSPALREHGQTHHPKSPAPPGSSIESSNSTTAIQNETRELLSMCSGKSFATNAPLSSASTFNASSSSTTLTTNSGRVVVRNGNDFSNNSLYPEVCLPAAVSTTATVLPPQFAPFGSTTACNQSFSLNNFTTFYNEPRPPVPFPSARDQTNNAAAIICAPQLFGPSSFPPSTSAVEPSHSVNASSMHATNMPAGSVLASFLPQQHAATLSSHQSERPVLYEEQIRKLLLFRRMKRRLLRFPEVEQSVDQLISSLECMQLVARIHTAPSAGAGRAKKDSLIKKRTPSPNESTPVVQDETMTVENTSRAQANAATDAVSTDSDAAAVAAAKTSIAASVTVDAAASAARVVNQTDTATAENAGESRNFAFLPLKKRIYRATVADPAATDHPRPFIGIDAATKIAMAAASTSIGAQEDSRLVIADADEDTKSSSATTTATTSNRNSTSHMDSAIDSVLRNVAAGYEPPRDKMTSDALPNEAANKPLVVKKIKPQLSTSINAAPTARNEESSAPTANLVSEGSATIPSVPTDNPRIVLKIRKQHVVERSPPKVDDNSLPTVQQHQQRRAKFFKSKGPMESDASGKLHDGVATSVSADSMPRTLTSDTKPIVNKWNGTNVGGGTATDDQQQFLGCEVIFTEPTILSTTPPVMAADSAAVFEAATTTTPVTSNSKKAAALGIRITTKPNGDYTVSNEKIKVETSNELSAAAPTKKRGRPPKNSLNGAVSKSPRSAEKQTQLSNHVVEKAALDNKVSSDAAVSVVKTTKRGRPPKSAAVATTTTSVSVTSANAAGPISSVSTGAKSQQRDKNDALDSDATNRRVAVTTPPGTQENKSIVNRRLPKRKAVVLPTVEEVGAADGVPATSAIKPLRFFSMLPLNESSEAPYHPAGLMIPDDMQTTRPSNHKTVNAAATADAMNSDDMNTEAGDQRNAASSGGGIKKRRTAVAARKRNAEQQQAIDTLESEMEPLQPAAERKAVESNKPAHYLSNDAEQTPLVKPVTVKIPKLLIKTAPPPTPIMPHAEPEPEDKSQVGASSPNKRSSSATGRAKRSRTATAVDASGTTGSPAKVTVQSRPTPTTFTASSSDKSRRRNSFVNNYKFIDRLTYDLDESLRPKILVTPPCQCQPPTSSDSGVEAGCDEFCTNRMVFTECSPETCPCAELCSNQRIRNGVYAVRKTRLELFDALDGAAIRLAETDGKPATVNSHAGCNTAVRWPTNAAEPIAALDAICEYAGQVMTSAAFEEKLNSAAGQYQFAKRQFAIKMLDYAKPAGHEGRAGGTISGNYNSVWPRRQVSPPSSKLVRSDAKKNRKNRNPSRVLLPVASPTILVKPTKKSQQQPPPPPPPSNQRPLVISTFEAGNESRYIRHSCRPSAKLELWLVDNEPRLLVCSRNKILPGQEITLDYGELAYARQFLCACGEKFCRRLVGSQCNSAAGSSSSKSAVDAPLLPLLWSRRRDHYIMLEQLFPKRGSKEWLNLCSKQRNQTNSITTSRILHKNMLAIQRCAVQQRNMLSSGKPLTKSALTAANALAMMTPSLLKDVLEKQIRPLAIAAGPKAVATAIDSSVTGVSSAPSHASSTAESPSLLDNDENVMTVEQLKPRAWEPGPALDYPEEEVIRCPCNWYVDVDDMVQCDTCQVWQHISCLALPKEEVSRDDFIYKCDRCKKQLSIVEREIPQRDEKTLLPIVRHDRVENCTFTYYLTLVADNCQDFQVRMNDYVYLTPQRQKPMPGMKFDLLDLDIMEVECLWKASSLNGSLEGGRRMAGGRRYYRPIDLHVREGTKFYPNELVRGAIDETVTLDSIVGRCCVMDLETYQLGRPKEYPQEHIYITEYECDERKKTLTKLFSTTRRSRITLNAASGNIMRPINEQNGAVYSGDDITAGAALTNNNREKGQPLRKINTNNYYFQRYGEKLVPKKQPLSLSRANKAKRMLCNGVNAAASGLHAGNLMFSGAAMGHMLKSVTDGSSGNIPSIRDVVVAKCMRLEKLRQKVQGFAAHRQSTTSGGGKPDGETKQQRRT